MPWERRKEKELKKTEDDAVNWTHELVHPSVLVRPLALGPYPFVPNPL